MRRPISNLECTIRQIILQNNKLEVLQPRHPFRRRKRLPVILENAVDATVVGGGRDNEGYYYDVKTYVFEIYRVTGNTGRVRVPYNVSVLSCSSYGRPPVVVVCDFAFTAIKAIYFCKGY